MGKYYCVLVTGPMYIVHAGWKSILKRCYLSGPEWAISSYIKLITIGGGLCSKTSNPIGFNLSPYFLCIEVSSLVRDCIECEKSICYELSICSSPKFICC